MGTWDTKIDGNDTFQDIYQNYFDLYNQGQDPIYISKKIQDDFVEMFSDHDDRYSSLFGLALAQWETKALDSTIFEQVKEIGCYFSVNSIQYGHNIAVISWHGDELKVRKCVSEK